MEGQKITNIPAEDYAIMTMHRPSNVDQKEVLSPLFNFINNEITEDRYLIWPIHPRTRERLETFDYIRNFNTFDKNSQIWKQP